MDPTLVKLQIRKGKSLIKLGHLVPAEAVFRGLLNSQYDHLNHIRSSFDKVLDGVKMEAKAGLRELEKIKNTIETLVSNEAKLEFSEVLKVADTILRVCPNHRVVQIAKANALNQLSKYEECKEYIEKLTLNMSLTIAVLYAHAQAKFPLPPISSLEWKESAKVANTIDVDVRAVANIFLCIGFELGTHYLMALKNLPISRSASADVMAKIKIILADVDKILQSGEKEEAWGWIPKELTKIKQKNTCKNFHFSNCKKALNVLA
jgi:tetratricopeptide (TPR) repeat protein